MEAVHHCSIEGHVVGVDETRCHTDRCVRSSPKGVLCTGERVQRRVRTHKHTQRTVRWASGIGLRPAPGELAGARSLIRRWSLGRRVETPWISVWDRGAHLAEKKHSK